MTSIDDPQTNLNVIKKAISKLDSKVRLLCLPENSLFLNLDKVPIHKNQAFHKQSPIIHELQQIARQRKMFLHLGGIPWVINDKVYNEALVINDQGEIVETYEKLHLFDVNLGPGLEISESKSYCHGQHFGGFRVDGWSFATAICYDIRFPEIFVHYMEKSPVDAFIVPAAFTVKTGEIHWKPLLHARAIESQTYVLAPAQVGYHRDLQKTKLRKSWGQSLVISPWGKILAETASYEKFLDSHLTEHEPITSLMERSELTSYRQAIPVADHRVYRMELFKK